MLMTGRVSRCSPISPLATLTPPEIWSEHRLLLQHLLKRVFATQEHASNIDMVRFVELPQICLMHLAKPSHSLETDCSIVDQSEERVSHALASHQA